MNTDEWAERKLASMKREQRRFDWLLMGAALAVFAVGTIAVATAQEAAHPGADGWTVLYEECTEAGDCLVVSENDKGEIKVDKPEKCGGATRIRRKPQSGTRTK